MTEFEFEGNVVSAPAGTTVLDALLEAGHPVDHGCKSGACQRCLLRAEGDFSAKSASNGLSISLRATGHFLSCQAKAEQVEKTFLPGEAAVPKSTAEVVGHSFLSPSVVHMQLAVGTQFLFRAGQFVRLEWSDGLQRSYSIATATEANSGRIDFHIRLIPGGQMSERVRASAIIGTSLTVHGPMGACIYPEEGSSEPLLMITSGTGLAPIWGVLQDALSADHSAPISVYHGSSTVSGLYFEEELRQLSMAHPNFTYVPCADEVEGESPVRLGNPLQLALEDHRDLTGFRVYSCGHPTLVRLAQKKCYIAGADLHRIHIDVFEPQ